MPGFWGHCPYHSCSLGIFHRSGVVDKVRMESIVYEQGIVVRDEEIVTHVGHDERMVLLSKFEL